MKKRLHRLLQTATLALAVLLLSAGLARAQEAVEPGARESEQATPEQQSASENADQGTTRTAQTGDAQRISPSLIGDKLTTEGIQLHKGEPGVVKLTWKTQSEESNFGFIVLRGKNKEDKFTRINKQIILGAGNSSTENVYEYYDLDVKVGDVYYYSIQDVSFSNNVRDISPKLRIQVNRRYLGTPPPSTKADDKATTATDKATTTTTAAAVCPLKGAQACKKDAEAKAKPKTAKKSVKKTAKES